MNGSHPLSHMTLWLHGLVKWCDKLKTSARPQCQQPPKLGFWQGRDLPEGAPSHVVPWPFNYVALWYHMSNILSPLPQCLWPPNLALWWYTMRSYKVTWCYNSCEVTQQIKCVISPFPTYMERWWITMGLPSIKPHNSLNLWLQEVAWQINIKLYCHNAYGHQTCQRGDIPGGVPIHKFGWPFSHVVL